jgi:uncharacterized protein YjbI with pentapeptide repeats
MKEQSFYEKVTFSEQDFSNQNLSGQVFCECLFVRCNLSNVKVKESRFQKVTFIGCQLMGVLFSECNPFLLDMSFQDCQIISCVFSDQKLSGICFRNCHIHECDFMNTDLTEASFEGCDLEHTIFENANLTMTSFVGADHYFFDPNKNKLKKTKLSLPGALSLLYSFDIILE